jgi:ribonuclease Y
MTSIIIGIIAFVLGTGGTLVLLRVFNKRARLEAEAEAELLKKNKLIEAKEKFIALKAEHEQQVMQRNAKVQEKEVKLQQREMQLNQKQGEMQRKINEVEALRETHEQQLSLLENKKRDLEHLSRQAHEQLEAISGLSADQAKERLIEAMKEEAKTEAMSYINDIMEEAKMTANKEAKKIVVQSIQRVATETAIENSVTVFHIESDEIKGRIIGREGRNIRALEAATGVEIIVDDTPEAIVLSAFDPVRREIARLSLHQLVTDGRIHPARIEEVVNKVHKQVEEEIIEIGKRTAIDRNDVALFENAFRGWDTVNHLFVYRYTQRSGKSLIPEEGGNCSVRADKILGNRVQKLGRDARTNVATHLGQRLRHQDVVFAEQLYLLVCL